MNIEIANRLVELRKKSGLSQEDLAEKLGLSRQAVSKWERAESSPDTDNLICLARLYNVSLDDLLNTDQPIDEIVKGVKDKEEEKKEEKKSDRMVLQSEDGSSVTIEDDGITCKSEDGKYAKIHGTHVEVYDEDGNIIKKEEKEKTRIEIVFDSITPILCVATYLILGFTVSWGWSRGWVIFLLIPIIPTIIAAVRKRRFCVFAYPVFATLLYLIAGLFFGRWSPEWVIFITIPVYYIVFSEIDKAIHHGKEDGDEE